MVDSPMDCPSSSKPNSSLPWLWVIQVLASCKQLDISTLHELIDAAPVRQDDFCEKTRELISLRCLEHLFESSQRVNRGIASASLNSRYGIDFSLSCQDVLLQIFDKVPVPTKKKVREEVLKWDVFPFVMHKRAAIKPDLEQLKESFSDGTHPYAHCLRECSRLVHRNRDHPVHVNDNECSDRLDKNGNKSSKQSLFNKIIPSKRNRVVSAGKHAIGYLHGKLDDVNESGGFQINGKKIRRNAPLNVESKKEKPVSPHAKRALENSTQKLLVPEREECCPDKHCEGEISSDTDWHDTDTIVAAEKHKILSSHCTFGHLFKANTKLTENNHCMKCNKVGELLVCKIATCQIKFHKTCLSNYKQIDEEGNFICPLCAYCCALSKYHEAKKEASLARTELAFFICKDLLHRETPLLHEVNRKKRCLSKRKRHV